MAPLRRIDVVLDSVKRLQRIGASANLINLLQKQHPADLAELFGELREKDCREGLALLLEHNSRLAMEALVEHGPEPGAALLAGHPPERLASWFQELPSDDAAALIDELPQAVSDAVLVQMRPRESGEVENLLEYAEQTAGRIMNPMVFALSEELTAGEAIQALQGSREVEMVFYLYVVDERRHLVGVISLRRLLLVSPETSLKRIMTTDLTSAQADTDQEEVAQLVASYNLLAILCCAALIPLVLTRLPQPETPEKGRLRPKLAIDRSPLAVAAVVVAALSSASFRMVGPIYGQEVGLTAGQIAWFLSAFVLGGALAQFPVGWLADKFDRRWVLIWLSAASMLSCAVTVMSAGMGTQAIFLAATFFGLTTFPIYSVAASHAHDFASSSERVELSAALMFWFAVGAIFAPYIASVLIEGFGPAALFTMISVGHGVLVLFGLTRMRARPTATKRTPYVYAPRTSFTIGRLMRRSRERDAP